ncbi:MAG: FlgD immunoglobulin-like domain containing protein [Candidatus Zixiibacteriota bacterium]
MKIYNVLGQLVRTLVNEPKESGTYEVIWDGRDDNGNEVASGIYFYRLQAGDFTEAKKMLLLR